MSYFAPITADVSQPSVLGKCNRPDIAKAVQPHYTQLIGHSRPGALPIVYSDVYNIGFLGVWHFCILVLPASKVTIESPALC